MKFFSGFLVGGVLCGLAVAWALWGTWLTTPCASIEAGHVQEKAGLSIALASQRDRAEQAARQAAKVGLGTGAKAGTRRPTVSNKNVLKRGGIEHGKSTS